MTRLGLLARVANELSERRLEEAEFMAKGHGMTLTQYINYRCDELERIVGTWESIKREKEGRQ